MTRNFVFRSSTSLLAVVLLLCGCCIIVGEDVSLDDARLADEAVAESRDNVGLIALCGRLSGASWAVAVGDRDSAGRRLSGESRPLLNPLLSLAWLSPLMEVSLLTGPGRRDNRLFGARVGGAVVVVGLDNPLTELATDWRDGRARIVGAAGGPIEVLLLILALDVVVERLGGGTLVVEGGCVCGDEEPEANLAEASCLVGDLVGD